MYELKALKRIFKIENFDLNKTERIKKNIETYKLKNEIDLTSNSCIYFIDELNAEKTEFYEEMKRIKEDIIKKL